MKIISWNVAGLRSLLGIGSGKDKTDDWMKLMEMDADIICLQETKIQEKHIPDVEKRLEKLDCNYKLYSAHCKARAGLHGVCFLMKDSVEFDCVVTGMGDEEIDCEGRVITLHTADFTLVNTYVPQSGTRTEYRNRFDHVMSLYLSQFEQPILCGDLNVARDSIDIYDSKKMKGKAGFRDCERATLNGYLNKMKDAYRECNPDTKCFSYWDYRGKMRKTNRGWRIDYFLVTKEIKDYDCVIHNDLHGSDHCPVSLTLNEPNQQ